MSARESAITSCRWGAQLRNGRELWTDPGTYLDEYRRLRADFTTDEWLDFMVRRMGYEPAGMERRLKLLFLTRLIPLCERPIYRAQSFDPSSPRLGAASSNPARSGRP